MKLHLVIDHLKEKGHDGRAFLMMKPVVVVHGGFSLKLRL